MNTYTDVTPCKKINFVEKSFQKEKLHPPLLTKRQNEGENELH